MQIDWGTTHLLGNLGRLDIHANILCHCPRMSSSGEENIRFPQLGVSAERISPHTDRISSRSSFLLRLSQKKESRRRLRLFTDLYSAGLFQCFKDRRRLSSSLAHATVTEVT